ncbi:MAG: (d)CMP kinase [Phycisphaerae bacterium]|nr:(d)CMP kinase [Phycisphaerae bacterium]
MIITIDGPAGSGKSSVAKIVAEKLNAAFLDTGAMYRAVTLAAMNEGVDLNDETALQAVLDKKKFHFDIAAGTMKVAIDGTDCTEDIRRPDVTANVKFIANAVKVRSKLVHLQRQFANENHNIVTEGRDQGTVVFPHADYKFFLIADPAERARRRHSELTDKGADVDIAKLEEDIRKRDASDENRKHSPLIKADDAIEIDTTPLDLPGVVKTILSVINITQQNKQTL